MDSFRYIRSALGMGVRVGILVRVLSGSNVTNVRVNLNDSSGIINRFKGTIKRHPLNNIQIVCRIVIRGTIIFTVSPLKGGELRCGPIDY